MKRIILLSAFAFVFSHSFSQVIVTELFTQNASCYGLCDGASEIIIQGGTPPYNIDWSDGTSNDVTGFTGFIQTGLNLCAGTHTVIVTDAIAKQGSVSIVVTEPTALAGNITPTDPLCFGDADGLISIKAFGGTPGLGGYYYLWSDVASQTTATATNLWSGCYTVTLADQNACTATYSSCLSDPPLLSVSVTTSPETPPGNGDGTAMATASGGTFPYMYVWDDVWQTTIMATGLSAGPYCVTVTDMNNCTVSSCGTIDLGTTVRELQNKSSIRADRRDIIIDSKRGTVDIFNTLGQKVQSASLVSGKNRIAVRDQGVYLVWVRTEGNTITKKVYVSGK